MIQSPLNDKIHSANYRFICQDFRQFDTTTLTEKDFVYADPPYRITRVAYNENDDCNDDLEYALLNSLDNLDSIGVRFALSNVLSSSGKKNKILNDCLFVHSEECNAVHLKNSYSDSNHHKINKNGGTYDEVLIINYKLE